MNDWQHLMVHGPSVAEQVETTTFRVQFYDLENRLATNFKVDIWNVQLIVLVPLDFVTHVVSGLQQTGYVVCSLIISSHCGYLFQTIRVHKRAACTVNNKPKYKIKINITIVIYNTSVLTKHTCKILRKYYKHYKKDKRYENRSRSQGLNL